MVDHSCSLQSLQVGLAALERAMRAPTRVIVENAGEEGIVIVGKLLENDADSNIGYNAATGGQQVYKAARHWSLAVLAAVACRAYCRPVMQRTHQAILRSIDWHTLVAPLPWTS
jgi:hypothetical protein